MKIIEFLESIESGCSVERTDLTTAVTRYLYLRKENIQHIQNIQVVANDMKFLEILRGQNNQFQSVG